MVKSPLNYIGGKYKLLPQLFQFFPHEVGTFVDVFTGGLDVSLNIRENRNVTNIICNDINHYIINMYKYFQLRNVDDIIFNIERIICQYHLSKQNENGFKELRAHFNQNHDPLELFVLVCFGYNHQLRFNNSGEFNNPFGRDRSAYNNRTEQGLRSMVPLLKDIHFTQLDFRQIPYNEYVPGDFVYVDPPYRITCGSYNDGKRGFEGWSLHDDMDLMAVLDNLDRRHIMFAMSNVLTHKGNKNQELTSWADNYNIHHINWNYNHCSYNVVESGHTDQTIEVLITNY